MTKDFTFLIIFLPFVHKALKDLDEFKKNRGQRIEDYFLNDKNELLELEKKALKNCPSLNILDNIFMQPFKVAHKDNTDTYLYNPSNQSVLDFILEQGWKKNSDNTPMM